MKFVRDINPKMIDIDIIKLALSEGRIIVTLDKDFGELVYNYKADHCGILLLRLDDASVVNKIKVLKEILQHHSDSLQNNFCVYQNGNLRIK
jgi:predicted nuclease of predicted toxin-antitoxin system